MRWEYWSPISGEIRAIGEPGYRSRIHGGGSRGGHESIGSLTKQTYPASLISADRRAIQPRIGIAWRPFLASSLVVRAGYGVYYNSLPIRASPVRCTSSTRFPRLSRWLTALPIHSRWPAGSTFRPESLPIHSPWTRTCAWAMRRIGSLPLQRDLPGSLIAIATYTGVKGTHEMQTILPNTFAPGAVNPCPTCPSGFKYLMAGGNSIRNSASLQLRRRLRAGFTSTLQYTFSKSIDDAALGGRGQGGSVIAQNWLDPRAERALSSFDQRHLASLTLQYTTGMGLGGGTLIGGWKGAMYKDWTIQTSINAGTGTPLNPTYSSVAAGGTGVLGTVRPNFTGASLYNAPAGLDLIRRLSGRPRRDSGAMPEGIRSPDRTSSRSTRRWSGPSA